MDIAEQEGSPWESVRGERNGPRCALEGVEGATGTIAAAQRRYREKEMELRSAEKLVNEKDILLKDCLERLHAALRAERVQLAEKRKRHEPGLMSARANYYMRLRTTWWLRLQLRWQKRSWQKLFLPRRSTISSYGMHIRCSRALKRVQLKREKMEWELAQKLACVEEEKIGLAEQVKQLSKQVADLLSSSMRRGRQEKAKKLRLRILRQQQKMRNERQRS